MVSCSAEKYTFSVNPWGTEEEMRAMYSPVLDYITEQTGYEFDMVFLPTYDAMLEEVDNGFVDFAQVNAVTLLKMRRANIHFQYLVTSVRAFGEGATRFEREHYYGYFITRADSKIEKLEDLKGKVFGFVEKSSGSGYKMPRAILEQMGETPDTFFKKYFFVGDHDEVAKAVYNKCVDAGATWEASYRINMDRYHDAFKIIFQTPEIPNDAWITGHSISNASAQKIKETLMGITSSTRTADGKLVLDPKTGVSETGFIERDMSFYEKAADLLIFDEKSEEE